MCGCVILTVNYLRRLRQHPIGTYESPVRLSKPAGAGLPVTYVSYTAPPLASIEPSRRRARAKAGWRYVELAVPHDVEVPTPDAAEGSSAESPDT